MRLTSLLTAAMLLIAGPLVAGEADVINVTVVKTATDVYGFSVTVRHDDTGWEHYADKWEVLDIDQNVLATRILYHPHVDEQPFTRSLSAREDSRRRSQCQPQGPLFGKRVRRSRIPCRPSALKGALRC